MNRWPFFLPLLTALPLLSQQPANSTTQLTIYNKDFAVARTIVPLDLHPGLNEVLTTSVTSQLEPDSVVLHDPTGRNAIQIVEQNYDAGVVNQAWLLQKYEGKTIDFQTYGTQIIETTTGEHRTLPAATVPGRIVRAGNNPLIEVNGHLQFQLPGLPVFPATTDGLLLKPTLRWQIDAEKAAHFSAELNYITHGMNWQATYNVVVPETTDFTGPELAEVLGWVTINNNSGTDFPQATIQLIAGDVAKLQDLRPQALANSADQNVTLRATYANVQVTQKPFDDFHLYDLHRTVALPDRETKQIQFLEAAGVKAQRTYQVDGNESLMLPFYRGYHNDQANFGRYGDTSVTIREEIDNTKSNHLGIPLPAGRLRLYRRDTGGQMQFVGEGLIPHTPAEQPLKITSGNAFDLTAVRRQTDFHVDSNNHVIDESFEIKLSNQKLQPVTIHAVEHMNRSQNWEITARSTQFSKRDSATIDFPVSVPAKGEVTLTYSVRYTW